MSAANCCTSAADNWIGVGAIPDLKIFHKLWVLSAFSSGALRPFRGEATPLNDEMQRRD